jgi:hypothetical protein
LLRRGERRYEIGSRRKIVARCIWFAAKLHARCSPEEKLRSASCAASLCEAAKALSSM